MGGGAAQPLITTEYLKKLVLFRNHGMNIGESPAALTQQNWGVRLFFVFASQALPGGDNRQL